jgi:putative Holliday junction resolvase
LNHPDDLRLLGVDYGTRRTGLAISDPGGVLASPLEVLRCRGLDDLAARIAERAKAHRVRGIVLGFPRHLDGRPGDLAEDVESLRSRLRDRGLTVMLWDERLSSWEATDKLREAGRSVSRRKGESVDAIAAAVILQSYLDSLEGD